MEKLNPQDAYKKNIFRPVLGDVSKRIPIPNNEGAHPTLDMFLDQINLPKNSEASDFVLHLHTSHYNELLEGVKEVSGFSGRFTRYRDFLLVFDEDMPKKLFYVCFIFDEICNLERLQSDDSRFFTQKEFDTLNYLRTNRFKKD